MKVKILPPHGSDRHLLDERSWAEMEEGSCVRDALRLVRCSPLKARLLLVSVTANAVPSRANCMTATLSASFSLSPAADKTPICM